MLNIERALKQDRLLRAMIGLNRKAFDALLPPFSGVYEQIQLQQPRQRALGGGRKARLRTFRDKLFYILFYFKSYPTFDLAGLLFEIDRAQAHYWMHRLQPILEATLGEKLALPERKLTSVEAFVERFPGVKRVMVDGTERPIARPQNPEAQKLNYSGKKKRHTRKHLAAVDQGKRVLVLSKAREGKLHDKKFHDEDDIVGGVPDEIPVELDLGFLGVQKQYDNIRIPHKKTRGGELTPEQKADNRALSQSRVVCENAFAGVKRYGAVSAVYRNRIEAFDDHLMLTAAGLWNFYLMAA
ncbi:transposase (plasmid) [Phormidium sp. CLA17]|uniref:transposase family protein n=1 Tax=Leptolyngbya sp. Cla-17 TaxID=2803751 RepID=UPI001491E991|nr:transposase family protein [Leptolyngbya sp. Cla-17]MBM0740806.1 transposase [Leptolyngbya sp. Cla-17]MBM0745299.1 transposase [Leptolyngbya sp. Cla-17]